MCNNCNNNIVNCDCNECNQGCPIQLDASCVFYNLKDTSESELNCIDLPNGTNLKNVIEELDRKLCTITTLNYNNYDLSCLRDIYVISTNRQFSEAVAREICLLKQGVTLINNTFNNSITQINNLIQNINVPNLTDNCFLGIQPTDTLSQILQKVLNKFCDILNINFSDQSPVLSTVNSSTISFITSGVKNHSVTANVRISPDVGNSIQARGNGLYVSTVTSGLQTISYDSGTRTITLSNGGGSITLPVDDDNQTLSFNPITKFLTISNGNSVDLSSLSSLLSETFITVIDSSSIDFTSSGTANHTISGVVKISTAVGNNISINPDGLFVPSSSFNPTLSEISDILTDIDGDAGLKNQIYSIIADSICFKFRLKNTGVSTQTYDYIDCSGNLNTLINLNAGAIIDVIGKSVDTLSTDIEIYNLGLN